MEIQARGGDLKAVPGHEPAPAGTVDVADAADAA